MECSIHFNKDLTDYTNSFLPEDGAEFTFDGTLGSETVFGIWLLNAVKAANEQVTHTQIKLSNFDEFSDAYNATPAGTAGSAEITATFIIPTSEFQDNNAHYTDLEGTRTYTINFTK